MKNLKFAFSGIALMLTLLFVGCTDPCKDVECNFGTCADGECVCNTGYEGANCLTALNAKFAGSYQLSETCSGSGPAGPYAVTVAAKSTPLDITFVGLWEVTQNIVNGVVGSDGVSFTIERQQITTGIDIECTTGSISTDGNTVNMTYKIYYQTPDSLVDNCTATLTK
jgi:hypothetical protein